MKHRIEKVSNKMATIFVTYDAGSRAEDGFSPGIAHMLEHSMFKGTDKRNWEELQREIAYLGGSSNAYTSNEMVCYYIGVPHENIEQATEILSDMCFNSTFPDEDFLKEREVVAEEESARRDQIYSWIWEKFDEEFFGEHHLGRPIIGTQESIAGFTNQEVKDFYNKFYTRDHMIVTLVSPLEDDDASAMLTKYFGEPDGVFEKTAPDIQHVPSPSKFVHLTKPDLQQSYLWIGYPSFKYGDDDRYAVSVLTEILSSGMDSRLFTEVREKRGLCYGIGGSASPFRDAGIFLINSSTQAESLVEMFETIDEQLELIRTELCTEEELQRAKNKLIATSYQVMESSHGIASVRLRSEFYSTGSLEEFIENIKQVTAEDVRDAAVKTFDDNHRLVMVVQDEQDVDLETCDTLGRQVIKFVGE